MGSKSRSSSSTTASNVTNDNDITANDGSIAVGAGGRYAQTNQDFEGGNAEAGGASVTGAGNSVSLNNGTQIGNGGVLNNGWMIGDNSEVHRTQLDDNTKSMLDSALALVGHNADNMMKLAASDSKAAQIGYLPPPVASGEEKKTMGEYTAFLFLIPVLLILGLIYAVKRKGTKTK